MGFGPIVEGSSPSPPAIYIEMNVSGVILAAGKGTRMKSNIPKVLHPVSGKKLVLYALEVIEDELRRKVRTMAARCTLGNVKRLTPELIWIALGKPNQFV